MRHRHVLVDEYQDVNRASVRLVKAHRRRRQAACGSSATRGSRSTGFAARRPSTWPRFKTEFPGADIDQLGISYRSTQQIIDAFTAFAPDMGASKGMLPLELKADRGDGPAVPDLRRFETR